LGPLDSNHISLDCRSFFSIFLLRLGVPQSILLIMATPSCEF
jgi:hypothetical protein